MRGQLEGGLNIGADQTGFIKNLEYISSNTIQAGLEETMIATEYPGEWIDVPGTDVSLSGDIPSLILEMKDEIQALKDEINELKMIYGEN